MYTKEEASKLRQLFWTTFGQYIAPQLSAEGLKINWVNYKTGIKHLYFRMEAGQKSAGISIEITHNDVGIQKLFFDQFAELKNILQSYLQEDWDWQLYVRDDNGKTVSRISKQISSISIYNRNDWPVLISFFKPRIIALDEFWSDARYAFESLK